MIVVTGTPRSGTSLLMDTLIKLLGEGKLVGDKFPLEREIEKSLTPAMEYIQQSMGERRSKRHEKNEIDTMNPNGFWESKFLRGLQVSMHKSEAQGFTPQHFVKVMAGGLQNTDPSLVSKMVICLREPVSCIDSQKQIMGVGDQLLNNWRDKKADTGMYRSSYKILAQYMRTFPDTEFLVVDYHEHVENPSIFFRKIADFVGASTKGKSSPVDPKLNREESSPLPKGRQWREAQDLYLSLKVSDFKAVPLLREQLPDRWGCPRIGRAVLRAECEACASLPQVTQSYKTTARLKKIDWANLPCLFECGFSGDAPKTIEASIKENSWR